LKNIFLNKSTKKLFLIFLIFSVVLSVAHIFIEKMLFVHGAEEVALDNAISKSKEREMLVKGFLSQSEDTLLSLARLKLFEDYRLRSVPRDTIVDIFLSSTLPWPSMTQLSYIDAAGKEQVRIERTVPQAAPMIIPVEKLGNYSGNYLFEHSKEKPYGKVWFSSIDLHQDAWGVPVLPYEPEMSAMLPLADTNGVYDGVIVVTYNMKNFLHKLANAPLYDMIMFNDRGYTIHHYDNTKSWGYYTDPRFNISDEFPGTSERILSSTLYRNEHFVSKKFDLPIDGGLNLILLLKKTYLKEQIDISQTQYILVSVIIFLLSLLLTFMTVKFFSITLLNLEEVRTLNTRLQSTRTELEQQRDELESIFTIALEGITILDREGNILRFNNKYAEIVGYSKDILKNKRWFDFISQEDREEADKAYKKALEYGYYENFESSYINKENEHKRLKSSIVLMPSRNELLLTTVDYSELHNAYKQIERQAYLDELTQLQNRKSYNEKITELLLQFKNYDVPFSILLFDIDHFKSVNDQYGHDRGDEVLKRLGQLVRTTVRSSDHIFRIGGEEFVILQPHTQLKGSLISAENLRKRVEKELWIDEGKNITVSIGATEVQSEDGVESIFKRVDICLYHAKQQGRNRVVSSAEEK